jgi:hypothetical protein
MHYMGEGVCDDLERREMFVCKPATPKNQIYYSIKPLAL